jgi:hypothetical protein
MLIAVSSWEHWIFDADDGIEMGNKVARQIYKQAMKPIDSQGQPQEPSSHRFSVADPSKKRSDLVCSGVNLPSGWDDTDPTKGFGRLTIVVVD